MPKPGGCHSSGISLGDALRLPKRHPAWRRREAQSGSRKKLTCSGHATNSRRYHDLGSTCLCRGREWLDLNGVAKVGQAFDETSFCWSLGRNSLAQAMPQTPGGTTISVRHAYAVAASGVISTA